MISLAQPLAVGNAIRLWINPEPGSVSWRVLRRTADIFTGPDDQGAVVVCDGSTDNVVLDLKALVNGTAYFYRAYEWTGSAWTATPSVSAVPAATYAGDAIDPLQLLHDRLEAGFAIEVARNPALADAQSGKVQVLKSPFAMSDNITFSVVFVHLDQVTPMERFLGDDPFGPYHEQDGTWSEFSGWLASTRINVGATSRNFEQRNALRRALVRIFQANLPVFAAAGLQLVEFSLTDSEQLKENDAPLYLTGGQFSCVAPSFVAESVPEITDVIVTVNAEMEAN